MDYSRNLLDRFLESALSCPPGVSCTLRSSLAAFQTTQLSRCGNRHPTLGIEGPMTLCLTFREDHVGLWALPPAKAIGEKNLVEVRNMKVQRRCLFLQEYRFTAEGVLNTRLPTKTASSSSGAATDLWYPGASCCSTAATPELPECLPFNSLRGKDALRARKPFRHPSTTFFGISAPFVGWPQRTRRV